MATAAIRLSYTVDSEVATSDANLTMVTAPGGCSGVLVQARDEGLYVQFKGAEQGAAVGVALKIAEDKAYFVTPAQCGVSGMTDWSFGVAQFAAGAKAICSAAVG